jgi:RNA polymerase sigma-70 factor (ECF subfamily)
VRGGYLHDGFGRVLSAAREGTEWGFSALYREFNPRLVRFFGAQAPSVAEDLAADTWLAVARQLPSFNGDEGAFRGWLFTIARGKLVQHWRDTGRRRSTPVAPEAFAEHAGADDPERLALEALSTVRATRAITAALPAAQADVVLLRVLGGLDVDQVAAIVGKPPGTVRVLQHRALHRLAATFSVEGVTR